MSHRTPALGLAAGALSLALAGCTGSSEPGPGPTSTPTGSVSPPASPTATVSVASPTIPPSPISPSPSAVACTTSSLRLSHGSGGAAAGTYYLPIVFTNTGASPCALRGYPGVSFVDDDGDQVGLPATRTRGEQVRSVVLAPGQQAHALVGMPNTSFYSDSECGPRDVAGVRVYPPDQTDALTTAVELRVCTTKRARASVGPVAPGRHA